MKILRYIGMGLLSLTGIGFLYLISKTYTVAPGDIGIVINHHTGKIEILEPGIHTLASPLRRFMRSMPNSGKQVFDNINEIRVNTADSIDTLVSIDIGYQIHDPTKATLSVENYRTGLKEAVSMSLAKVIRDGHYSYRHLASARNAQPNGQHKIGDFCRDLSDAVSAICSHWGILLTSCQMVDMRATEPAIERQIQDSAQTQFKAQNNRAATELNKEVQIIQASAQAEATILTAKADAEAIKIKAAAKAQSIAIKTLAQKNRIEALHGVINSAPAQHVLDLDANIEVSKRLSKVTALGLGHGGPSLFSNPINVPVAAPVPVPVANQLLLAPA